MSGVVPSGFEAYVAVRHPAWRHDCTEENLRDLLWGREICRPVRWGEVAETNFPVVYGYVLDTKLWITKYHRTQYRRLQHGGWIVDKLPQNSMLPVRPGDSWITGPREGTLELDLVRTLRGVLVHATADSELCWFGIWEGFGYLTDEQRAAPAIEAPGRRWHLFRAPLDHLERSFDGDCFGSQRANLVWPENRSWCLATEISAEVTYVGGGKELISAILDEPGLEAVPAQLDERLAGLRDVLTCGGQADKRLFIARIRISREAARTVPASYAT